MAANGSQDPSSWPATGDRPDGGLRRTGGVPQWSTGDELASKSNSDCTVQIDEISIKNRFRHETQSSISFEIYRYRFTSDCDEGKSSSG